MLFFSALFFTLHPTSTLAIGSIYYDLDFQPIFSFFTFNNGKHVKMLIVKFYVFDTDRCFSCAICVCACVSIAVVSESVSVNINT